MTTMSLPDSPSVRRMDPDAVRAVPGSTRPAGPGGLSLPVLALAALVASPAIYQCLVRHTIPTHVMLERYVLIALGCLVVSEVARRFLGPARPAGAAPAEEGTDPAVTGGPTTTAAASLGDPFPPSGAPAAPAAPGGVDPALALLGTED